MDNGTPNGNLLSSWKEIAAYLKCTVRSCIRWEKTAGLPVHRSADAPGARVYAFKPELDEWLNQRSRVQTPPKEGRGRNGKRIRAVVFGIPVLVVAIGAFLLVKPGPPKSPAPRFDRYSIITSQPWGTGSLRTWEAARSDGYENTWKIFTSPKNTVMHTTIAAGDIDGDGRPELAAPAAFRRTYYKGEEKSLFYCIFINFYKEGTEGIWKTTFYSEGDFVWEASDHRRNEVLLENIDSNPSAEIILKTATALSVLRYDPTAKEIRLTDNLYGFLKDKKLLLRSVTTAKGRSGDSKTLIVSANEMNPSNGVVDLAAGWVLFIERGDKGLEVTDAVPVDAGLCDFSLRVGDLTGRGDWGVYSTAVRKTGEGYAPFLLGWDLAGNKTVDMALPDPARSSPVAPILAVKDISFEPGDDILVCVKPKRLLLYSHESGSLNLKADQELETPGATVNAFAFGDTDEDKYLEIVVAGGVASADGQERQYYLDVLGCRTGAGEFFSKWKTIGGEKGEREAAWVIASRDLPRK